MPKKTAAKKKTMSKADFIRSQPKSMPAKDVIAKAKAAGIALKEDAVYKTRSLDKARGKKKSSAGGKARKNTRATAPRSSSNGAIIAFYRAVKGIGGVSKAKELLVNIEAFENA